MRLNLKFRFNSGSLSAYFIISAVGFILLYVVIWTLSVRAERIANLRHDVALIMGGISGSILGTAELDSQGLQDQSLSLMQEYLNFTFDSKKSASQERVAKVSVYLLNPDRQLIGEWVSTEPSPIECLEKRTEYFQPVRSPYPYLVELTINTCSDSHLSIFEYHSISLPIIVSLAVILFWGLCITAMLKSIGYAGKLLEQTEDVDELLEKANKINWLNVRILAQKAVQVRGKNLQFFQTLVLDAQHDIAKVLDTVDRKYTQEDLNYNISVIRGIMQRLAIEIRSSDDSSQEINSFKELNSIEILKFIRSYFVGCKIENELPDNCIISIADISLFERIIVNLSSNAIKHAKTMPSIKMYYIDNYFLLRIYSQVSILKSINIHFAKFTNRIDVVNINSPVLFKFFGRTGRGLSIIKRGTAKLNGKMVFDIKKQTVETGFNIPAFLKEQISQIESPVIEKMKVILFKREDLKQKVIECGLEKFIVSQEELNSMIQSSSLYNKIEVVSDEELKLPESFTLRLITKKERIEGLALNWIGDSKR